MHNKSAVSVVSLVALVSIAGCATSNGPSNAATPRAASRSPSSSKATQPVAPSTAATDDGSAVRERRMKIWGQVQVMLKNKHGQLPPLTRAAAPAVQAPPAARVVNDTDFGLSVWFAGPCGDKIVLPKRTERIITFCPGTYDVAAQVDSPAFLPLVGKDQIFKPGVTYVLTIVIRQAPTTTRKRRWIKERK